MASRRQFLQYSLQGAALSMISGISRQAVSADVPENRPNVLFIAIDDLNDWIGCLGGHPDVKTPHIDRLADRGVLFTRAYCSAPACNPSRASLLTGILPSTSGVYHNDQPWRPALPDAVTLPRHFKDNGYLVKGRGKIFHGGHSQDEQAYHQYIQKGPDPEPENKPLNGIPNAAHFDWGPVDAEDRDMDDTQVAEWAGEFLGQEHDKPFFLACGLFRPHLPWYVPARYFDLYPPETVTLPNINEKDLDDVPPIGRAMAKPQGDHKKVIETGNWRKAVAGYLACISFTDANVGRILAALDNSRYANNTIVVLWGDHGWHLGEKLHWRKFALWEEATHAPLIVSVPGSPQNGKRCARTVSFLDLYPTLAQLCRLPALTQWEGTSLLSLLREPSASWDKPALTTHGRMNHSIRSERWRYIRYSDGTEELYDHDADELEWTNLAGQDRFNDVKQDLARWLPAVNAADAPSKPKDG